MCICHSQESIYCCCSIKETWALWQDYYEQCHIIEDWLSATEEILAKIGEEVSQPEDEQMQVIVSLCKFLYACCT